MTKERMTDPEGEGLADDLIGDDPIPDDARRFDENGHALPPESGCASARIAPPGRDD
ncbi:MAG: hypothetical protein ABI895_20060 [Deltaproteobacteria bacterium]